MGDTLKRVLVIGFGPKTGPAVARFLAVRGMDVTVSDIKTEAELGDDVRELDPSVKLIAGHQSPEILNAGFDLAVLSPGVPKAIPLVAEAVKRGIPVISEIELAFRNMKGRIIGITGTDGKSTTTSMVWHIFRELGFDAYIGGNIGIPLISFADKTGPESVSVVELSSFQLETVDTFRPDVSAILNVTPDHLDRYRDINAYFDAKKRIFMNQVADDYFIYNGDSGMLSSAAAGYPANSLRFSVADDSAGSFFRDGTVYIHYRGRVIPLVAESGMSIIGIHNMQNTMASALMVLALHEKLGMEPDFAAMSRACASFRGLEHRMEFVGEYMGRIFVNDSKATTIGAVEMAVRSIKDKGVIILGGRTKGDDYTRLRGVLAGKVRTIVLIGESSASFSEIFRDFNHVLASDMEDAVLKSMKFSENGDMILLSPACASFDMFSSYDERGRVFKGCYAKLVKGGMSWN